MKDERGWSAVRRAVVAAAEVAGLEKVAPRDPNASAEELAAWVVSSHAGAVVDGDRALAEALEAYATTLRIVLVAGTPDPLAKLTEYLADLCCIGEGEHVAAAALRALRMRAAKVRDLCEVRNKLIAERDAAIAQRDAAWAELETLRGTR